MPGLAGVIAIETNTAGVTLSVVDPDIEPEEAAIVVMPVSKLLARPFVSGPLLIVATVAFEELQCTVVVMSCVLPSVNVPVAVNC
jgi:hypothetical protein